jgi:16S rRNA (cytosine1402-N4)-methyltransferase
MAPRTEHRPVLLAEALCALAPKPAGIYLDATFGRGGHSRALLEKLGSRGRVIALDRDPQAVAAAAEIRDPRFIIRHARFSALPEVLDALGIARVDGMLFDLGVSSPQLETPERGFSFRLDGPLDMRMDPTHGESAAQWLSHAGESEIREVIREYGEERFAQQIAKAIVAARTEQPLRTTRQLAQLVGQAVRTREAHQDPATRTFQALRIFLNQELEDVSLMLPLALERLSPGGRLAVISFHSLEDRIVKRFLARSARPPMPRGLPLRESEMPAPLVKLIGKPVRACADELAANSRARSAIMRVAERTSALLPTGTEVAWRS